MRRHLSLPAIALAMASPGFATVAHGEAAVPDAGGVPTGPKTSPAAPGGSACQDGVCKYRLSSEQLLAVATRLVNEKKYSEAGFILSALKNAPDMAVPYKFLEGMIALESGDAKSAAEQFRAILAERPGETRVRLELAKVLLAQGKLSAGDYHLRLAQNDKNLPEDIGRAITNARSIIRSKKRWKFGFDFGFAPDTNINAATSAQSVDINFGPTRLPVELDDAARARSGIGITASVFGSVRLPVSPHTAIVADLDANMVNYKGKDVDDYSGQLGIGLERRLGQNSTIALQGVSLYRWYGGRLAARQFGAKLSFQHDLSATRRIGFQLDGRHSDSDFGDGFTGWQIGLASTYEHVVAKSAIVSASIFARREAMDLAAYSSKTVGFNLGIGGELPLGINAGVYGGISRAVYDAPQTFFSEDPRKDWRFQTRVYLGLRQIRVMGFSPSIEYNFSKVATNYTLYKSTRHRAEFKIARYF